MLHRHLATHLQWERPNSTTVFSHLQALMDTSEHSEGRVADNRLVLPAAKPGSCFINNTTTLLNIAFGFGFSLFVVIYFSASFSGAASLQTLISAQSFDHHLPRGRAAANTLPYCCRWSLEPCRHASYVLDQENFAAAYGVLHHNASLRRLPGLNHPQGGELFCCVSA